MKKNGVDCLESRGTKIVSLVLSETSMPTIELI